jgi:sulfur-oxidizing protein SoxY
MLRAGGGLLAGLLVAGPARAEPAAMAAALEAVARGRTVNDGRVSLELPRIADDGNVVSMSVRVDSAQTEADHVRVIHVFSEQNPVPVIVRFFLGPVVPRAEVATRIRLARSQLVRAVAEMGDGSLWSAAVQVEVTISACGD